MNKLDKKIKRKFIQNVKTTVQYDDMIQGTIDRILNDDALDYTVINKKKQPKFLKMIASFTVVTLIMGSVGTLGILAYSALGGTIKGKPAAEWLGIKFSDSYNDYVVDVEGEGVTYNDTTVDLVSTMCDDGFTVLEFDVKLSKEDKEYLKVGERVVSEERIEKEREQHNESLKNLEGTSEEKYIEKYKEQWEKEIELDRNYINGIQLLLNAMPNGDMGYNPNNYNLIIDDEETWVRWCSYQTVKKISDYEFKVYQYYFLPEDKIENKTEFDLKFKNIVLMNGTDMENVPKGLGMYLTNTPENERYITLDGEMSVQVSKEKALENTKYIDASSQKVSYNGINQTIEKITVTPMQTIIKLNVEFERLSSNNMGKTICGDYKIYNQNGEIVNKYSTEIKREITYKNGTKEQWEVGDLETSKTFDGATMNLTTYIVIGNDEDIESLKIVPTQREVVDNSEVDVETDVYFDIKLKN